VESSKRMLTNNKLVERVRFELRTFGL